MLRPIGGEIETFMLFHRQASGNAIKTRMRVVFNFRMQNALFEIGNINIIKTALTLAFQIVSSTFDTVFNYFCSV